MSIVTLGFIINRRLNYLHHFLRAWSGKLGQQHNLILLKMSKVVLKIEESSDSWWIVQRNSDMVLSNYTFTTNAISFRFMTCAIKVKLQIAELKDIQQV